jgi:ABC-type multidrug transport system fused ATPase/permease subunit
MTMHDPQTTKGTEGGEAAGSGGRHKPGGLPALQWAELPKPLRLRKMIGPGIILVAVGIGSGEYISHPYITSQVGLTFLWAAAVGLGLQYFLNTEVARYTLATGETAVTGFTRLWKGWAPLFVLMTVIPFAWPGWMTSASTMVTFVAGGQGNVQWISVAGLVVIGLVLTLSPIVYKTVEKIEFLKVIAILIFAVIIILFVIGWEPWAALPGGTVQGAFRMPEGISASFLITAMVFAGGGGAINLTVSNYIRDKGWGMGAHAPRIVSPLTGHEEAGSGTGVQFAMTPESERNWKTWWKNAKKEQFWSFFVIGLFTITVFSLLAYRLMPVGTYEGKSDLSFIQVQANILGDLFGGPLQIFYLVIGAVALMFANLAVVDIVSRLVADVLAVSYLRDHKFWTEAKIYSTCVWTMVGLGVIILSVGITQPITLLAMAAILNCLVMVVYAALLIQLNRRLHKVVRITRPRIAAMGFAVLFYAAVAVITIVLQIQTLAAT